MYQTIGESIAVAGVYQLGRFLPKKFRWGKREYWIDNITLTSDVRDGRTRKRLYSVVSGQTVYRLEFNRENETWKLEEIWCE